MLYVNKIINIIRLFINCRYSPSCDGTVQTNTLFYHISINIKCLLTYLKQALQIYGIDILYSGN